MPSRSEAHLTLVCCTLGHGGLQVLVRANGSQMAFPRMALPSTGTVEVLADGLAKDCVGRWPAWRAQAGGLLQQGLTVIVAAIVPAGTAAVEGYRWVGVRRVPATATAAMRMALGAIRDRLDQDPVAFRLLPATFALSDLQRVYETLLERRLHKASFRRALLAAHLVEPTDGWRSEGRGRPAQLFRYRPRRRRPGQRPVRFELLH